MHRVSADCSCLQQILDCSCRLRREECTYAWNLKGERIAIVAARSKLRNDLAAQTRTVDDPPQGKERNQTVEPVSGVLNKATYEFVFRCQRCAKELIEFVSSPDVLTKDELNQMRFDLRCKNAGCGWNGQRTGFEAEKIKAALKAPAS